MAKRRRSLLAAAASAVGSALAGCLGGNGGNGRENQSNNDTTGGGSDESSSPPTVDSSFPQYQYDAANTGTVPENSGPTGAIASLFEFGTVGTDQRLGSPAVADGTVYVTVVDESDSTATPVPTATGGTSTATTVPTEDDNSTVTPVPTGDGISTMTPPTDGGQSASGGTTVTAIDAVEGTVQWETTYSETGNPGPTAVVGDTVLAPVGGSVAALDAAAGDRQWAYDCGLASGITVAEEAVYVVGVEDGTATLYSLSAADGTVGWETTVDAETNYTTPAVADGTAYVGGAALQAFDTADGSEQWRVDTAVSTPPAVVEDAVVVGSESALSVYDTTGAEQWSADLADEESVSHSPAVADGTLYLSVDGEMRAYDLDSGERAYAVELGVDGPPVVADGYVYLLGSGQLTCLVADDGALEWSYGTQQHTDTGSVAPAVVDGVAYFPAERLYAIAE